MFIQSATSVYQVMTLKSTRISVNVRNASFVVISGVRFHHYAFFVSFCNKYCEHKTNYAPPQNVGGIMDSLCRVCPSVCPSVGRSVGPSVGRSACPSVRLSGHTDGHLLGTKLPNKCLSVRTFHSFR